MRSVFKHAKKVVPRSTPRNLKAQQWRFSPTSSGATTKSVTSSLEPEPTSTLQSMDGHPIIDAKEPVPPIVSDLLNTEPVTTAPDEHRFPMMVPDFWTGQAPIPESKYLIDCSNYNIFGSEDQKVPQESVEALLDKMDEVYNASGLCVLKNTGLTEVADMKRLVDYLVTKGGANSRRPASKNVYDTGAPFVAHLHYHHEMAYVGESVRQIAFMCTKAPNPKNGPSFVSDGVQSTDALLATPFGQKLKKLGLCYVRCLTDREQYKDQEKGWNGMDEIGVYNHWQQSFGVETQEEVEELAARRNLQVEWGPNRYCKTKYYVSAFEYFPELDRNLLYSSLADDSIWFDSWPGVMQLPTMSSYDSASPDERPLKLLFGDDSEMTRDELQQFLDVYDNYGMPVYWDQVGDIAVMCNWRWAHGRPAFNLEDGEDREIGVVLGEMYKRQGCRADKW